VSTRRRWSLRLLSIVVVLSVWEVYGRSIPEIFVSRPSLVGAAFGEVLGAPAFWRDLAQTLTGLSIGYSLAVVVGAVVGFLMGRYPTFALLVDPYVTFLYATPRIALIPLLIIMLGIDLQLRVAIVFLSSVFPVIINTQNGVRGVDGDLVETAVAFNASERQILRTVIFPATLPFLLSGIQIALGQAIIGVIVVEMTVAISGIGGEIVTYGNAFMTAQMLVPIFVTSGLSLAAIATLRAVERVLMPYRFLAQRRRSGWPWRRAGQGLHAA